MAIADLNIILGVNLKQFDRDLRKAQSSLKKTAADLQNIGDSVNSAITVPFGLAAAAGTKLFIDIDTNFSKIENLVGVAGDQLDQFRQGVERISGTTARSQNELSAALFTITSAGERGAGALDVLETAAKAAAVGLGSTDEIAKAIVSTMTAYGPANITAARAAETLFKTIREGNLDAATLAPRLGDVLPVAASLGVSFEELGANIATFTRLGASGSKAVSTLQQVLSNIQKPTTAAREALKGAGLSVEQLQESLRNNGLSQTLVDLISAFKGNTTAIAEVFGSVEGLTNVLGVAQSQGETYLDIARRMKEQTDFLGEGFENTTETVGFKFNQALEDTKNALVSLGDIVAPIVGRLAGVISNVGKFLSALDSDTKKTIVTVASFAAGVGVALKGLGLFTRGIADTIGVARSMTRIFSNIVERVLIFDNAISKAGSGASVATGVFGSLTKSLRSAATGFKALNTVTKFTVIGAAAAIIGTAVVAYQNLSKAVNTATIAQRTNQDVTARATAQTAAEIANVKSLVGIIKDQNATRDQQKRALQELQRIQPDYFAGINNEKTALTELDGAYENFVETLTLTARARVAAAKFEEVTAKLEDAKKRVDELNKDDGERGFFEKLVEEFESDNAAFGGFDFGIFTGIKERAAEDVEAIQSEADELAKIIDGINKKLTDQQQPTKTPTTTTTTLSPTVTGIDTEAVAAATAELARSLDVADERLKIHGNQYELVSEKVKAYEKAIGDLLGAGVAGDDTMVLSYAEAAERLRRSLDGASIEPLPPLVTQSTNDNITAFAAALSTLPTISGPMSQAIAEHMAVVTGALDGVQSQAATVQSTIEKQVLRDLAQQMEQAATAGSVFGDTFDVVGAQMGAVENAINTLVANGFDQAAPAIIELIDLLQSLQNQTNDSFDAMKAAAEEWNAGFLGIIEQGLETMIGTVAAGIGDILAGVGTSAGLISNVLSTVAGVMEQLGQLAIASGVTITGIKAALETLNPVVAIAAGVALIALSRVVKARAAELAKPPALAEGGLAFGETLATVGDNPNARIDPEVITPLSKLKEYIQPAGGDIVATYTVRGADLVTVLRRAERNVNRRRL